jgi:hypothetical protein
MYIPSRVVLTFFCSRHPAFLPPPLFLSRVHLCSFSSSLAPARAPPLPPWPRPAWRFKRQPPRPPLQVAERPSGQSSLTSSWSLLCARSTPAWPPSPMAALPRSLARPACPSARLWWRVPLPGIFPSRDFPRFSPMATVELPAGSRALLCWPARALSLVLSCSSIRSSDVVVRWPPVGSCSLFASVTTLPD